MDDRVLHEFLEEIVHQGTHALIAMEDIEIAVEEGSTWHPEDPPPDRLGDFSGPFRIWYSVHSFLIAVGNISKILWPGNSDRNDDWAKHLRATLLASEYSSLNERKFRNRFEHFDERLERWAKRSDRIEPEDRTIEYQGQSVGIEEDDQLRRFDARSNTVKYRGEEYDLDVISREVSELRDTAWKKVVELREERRSESENSVSGS